VKTLACTILSFTLIVTGFICPQKPVLTVTTIATHLDVPWEIKWGPDGRIWFTEQKGLVRAVDPTNGAIKTLLRLGDAHMQRAVGLLGLAFHPDFPQTPLIYIDYSYLSGDDLLIKLVSYEFKSDTLVHPEILIDRIPATETHNGSRLVIDAGGEILMTTGDIDKPALAQDLKSPNGKVLRLNLDGSIPSDNPIPGNAVWSWGHRNSQGLVVASNGILYSSEHGDATDDEINIIEKGRNYGWPNVQGRCDSADEKKFCLNFSVTEPIFTWTPTIAPSGIDYYGASEISEWANSLLVCTLKDASLHVLKLNDAGTKVVSEKKYLVNEYGRLRDICVSPSGEVYISTSNRDWNKTPGSGFPKQADDCIIRISLSDSPGPDAKVVVPQVLSSSLVTGKTLYDQYCSSCHKEDGEGVAGVFPPLVGTSYIKESSMLRKVIANGLSGKPVNGAAYTTSMPAFNFLDEQKVASLVEYVQKQFGGE
jgi:glucose/arabinose dehydrogenase/mono/diheme cytochrome c family protein